MIQFPYTQVCDAVSVVGVINYTLLCITPHTNYCVILVYTCNIREVYYIKQHIIILCDPLWKNRPLLLEYDFALGVQYSSQEYSMVLCLHL